MKKKFTCIIIGLGSMGNKYISIAKKIKSKYFRNL